MEAKPMDEIIATFRPDLFAGKQEMYPTARLTLGTVDEYVHIQQLVINEAYRLQRCSRRVAVAHAMHPRPQPQRRHRLQQEFM